MSNLVIAKQSSFPSPEEFQVMKDITLYAFNSGLLPSSVNSKEKALIIVMKSRALGIDPMHGLWSISVINNKPCMSAELMLTMIYKNVQGATVDYVKTDNNECVIEAQRPGGKKTRFTFTIEDARRANLLKGPWLTYPAAMLRARCVSAMARAMFSDALAGVIYTPEEMGADVNEDGEIRDVTPPDDTPPSGGKKPQETKSEEVSFPQSARPSTQTDPQYQANANRMSTVSSQGKSPGDYRIQKGRNEWVGRTIRQVLDGDEKNPPWGLPEFQKDVNWWASSSRIKHFPEIIHLKENLDAFTLEIQANHAEASEKSQPEMPEGFDSAYDLALSFPGGRK